MRLTSKLALGLVTILGLATTAFADDGKSSYRGGHSEARADRDDMNDIRRLHALAVRYDEALAMHNGRQRERIERQLRATIQRELLEGRFEIRKERAEGDYRSARALRKIQARRMSIANRLETMRPYEVKRAIQQLIRLERQELRLS
jgi:hypothetical protein